MNKYEAATNLAFFLLEKTGTVLGTWSGHMPAAAQRALFGRFLGKGTIVVDGVTEEVHHYRKVCFGMDYETTATIKWVAL